MKKVILFTVAAMMMVTSCQGEPNLDSIPVMEYGDCEMEEGITFYFDGVIDLIYAPEEQKYYIEYMDPDVFDEDNIGDYITIVTSKVTFFEVLADLEKSREEQVDMEINRKWVILPRDLAPGYQLRKCGGRHE